MDVPSSSDLARNTFMELLGGHGCVYFILVTSAIASRHKITTYSENHRSLDNSSDRDSSLFEHTLHVLQIRYIALEKLKLATFGSDICEHGLGFLILVSGSTHYNKVFRPKSCHVNCETATQPLEASHDQI